MTGQLYFGDNLTIMRDHIADESVDLIYLDPPFNSNASYNVLFKSVKGDEADSQLQAFDDTWQWSLAAEEAFDEVMSNGSSAATMLRALRSSLGDSNMMAYLTMMCVRLIEMRRVLRETGSLYLHCDPTASHYLKIILDAIFGAHFFRNEIIWRRTGSHNSSNRFGPVHDVILFYSASDDYYFQRNTRPYMVGHVEKAFVYENGRFRTNYSGNVLTGSGTRNGMSGKPWKGFDPTPKNRHWALPSKLIEGMEEKFEGLNQREKFDKLYDMGLITINEGDEWPRYNRTITANDGQYIPDIWAYQPYTEGTVFGTDAGIDDDVRWMGSKDSERLGYPTQKPVGLLERIISCSSKEGDTIFDPFCGCGTSIDAAEKLNRNWVGIDVTHLAIQVIKDRLSQNHPSASYKLGGVPTSVEDAKALAQHNKIQFEFWVVGHIGGQPKGYAGADKGVDGRFMFKSGAKEVGVGIISVKGGKSVGPAMVRELHGTMAREAAEMGVFICLDEPTPAMRSEAASAGIFTSESGDKYPKLQILSLEDIFNGRGMQAPPLFTSVTARDQARRGKTAKVQDTVLPKEALRQKNILFGITGGKSAAPEQVTAQAVTKALSTKKRKTG